MDSVDSGAIMEMKDVLRALEWQADHAFQNSAPCTARVIRGFIALLGSDLGVGERMRNWPGLSLEDAMPLRLAGGFHNLLLTGTDTRLGPVYAGEITDQAAIDALVLAVAKDHDRFLLGWFDGPPQTNEAGRSAGVMAQLLWLSSRLGTRFELFELGGSAGINTMLDRFAFELGGVTAGLPGSSVHIKPEWRGPPPPRADVEITSIRACDVAPIDLTDQEQALRLKSYVWPDVSARMRRIDAAIAMTSERPPLLERSDGGDFVTRMLAREQAKGTTRVLFHTIVWQYLPLATRGRIKAAMEAAGTQATHEKPLAWVTVETNRQTFQHELRCRYWPGGAAETLLGVAHAHGAWVEWFSPPLLSGPAALSG